MNATGLPIPNLTAPATPASAEPLASLATAHGPADFVLALAQMLGTSVPIATTEQALPATVDTREEDSELTMADAAALGLLPLPLAPPQPQPMAGQGKVADPLEVLGLTPRPDSANARDAAILQALTERLAGIEETSPDSLPTTATPATTQPEAVQHRAASTETAHHSRPLQHHVGTQAWADELGTRLTMLTDKGQHTASLRLSPEHLGPLEIRIAMREDQASVWFGAAHADTRAAIEHALPRLRELFAAEGMSLADTGVFREAPNQQPAQWQAPTQNNNEPSAATETECAPPSVQIGLLDAYA